MKKFLTLLLTLILAVSSMGLLACTPGKKGTVNADAFYVAYYNGGYGDDWIEEFVVDFLKSKGVESPKKGTDYELYGGGEDIQSKANTYLSIGINGTVPDLIISEGVSKNDVSKGLVEPLENSVYQYEVSVNNVSQANASKVNNGKIKIGDYIDQNVKASLTYGRSFGQNEHIWGVPWTRKVMTICYNETLVLNTVHDSNNPYKNSVSDGIIVNNKWSSYPKTFDDLCAIFYDLNEADTAPFGWGYNGSQIFDYLINVWWANYVGLDEYYDFWEANDPNYWSAKNREGIMEAWKCVEELFCSKTSPTIFINSLGTPTNLDWKDAQHKFALGECAFMVTSDYFSKEESSAIKSSGATFKFMPIPVLAKGESVGATEQTYSFTSNESIMYVPQKAKHKDMSIEFLEFINSETYIKKFTNLTGGIRPFDCDVSGLTSVLTDALKKSIFDMYYDSLNNSPDNLLMNYPIYHSKNYPSKPVSPVLFYGGILHTPMPEIYTVIKALRGATTVESYFNSNATEGIKYNITEYLKNWNRDYGENWKDNSKAK